MATFIYIFAMFRLYGFVKKLKIPNISKPPKTEFNKYIRYYRTLFIANSCPTLRLSCNLSELVLDREWVSPSWKQLNC